MMSTEYMTIHVLAAGDLFRDVLNAITVFMNQSDFSGLLRIMALVGIVMVSAGFLKSRDPQVFAKWFLGYVLCTNVVLLPKTSVLIDDTSFQKQYKVDNVPVVFAATANLLTTIGYGLAQSYDALFATPGDFAYTKTGALFGARIIDATHDFRILDPTLKDEMDHYFRSCVVGDIRLNQKYGVGDLATSANIWSFITKKPSPLRMTEVGGIAVTCLEASKAEGTNSLRARLNAEIKRTYSIFGINLFGKQKKTDYEALFDTHLKSAARYYQTLTDSASNIFLQSMMINAMRDGVNHYQAFTDSTASVISHEFTKSQLQHRWSWDILGQKAVWFLPLLHTNLTLILFGVFPLVLAMTTLPSGGRIFKGYIQFFLSLQCWPVLFAIINHVMTNVGVDSVSGYGPMTMVNIDKITELNRDISGVAGYIMAMIPFIAKGLVSNLGEAFNGLATSITGHVQGSGMAAAGEAASASFGLGQTNFHNTSANNFSANKHDSNWTHMHGMHTEQLGSGVLKTITGDGSQVFDVGPGMSRNAVSINASEGLSASLNQAYEESRQVAQNESSHYQTSLSSFAHRAVQLSQMQGHDMRLGDGVSASESGQYSKALSTLTHIAEDVAKRTGMNREDALQHLTSGGWGVHAGIRSDSSLAGKILKFGTGLSAGADAHLKFDRASTSSDRYHQGVDGTISAREAKDFNDAMNFINHFSQTHHFDESHSTAASLSNQLGTDLREAVTSSRNMDASLSKAARIQAAKSYVESHSSQINTDLNQAFPAYVATRLGESARDELFESPGDIQSLHQLQALGQEFIAERRDEMISNVGYKAHQTQMDESYIREKNHVLGKENELAGLYQKSSSEVTHATQELGMNTEQAELFKQSVQQQVQLSIEQSNVGKVDVRNQQALLLNESRAKLAVGMEQAQKNTILPKDWAKNSGLHNKGEENG